jgi:transaldolase/glucose-6-phosphate isomerase
MGNPLLDIQQYGQSIWYDNIRRGLITSGELQRLVDEDGLRGVTSNPAIFEKAITGSTDYDEALQALEQQPDLDAKAIYEHLAVGDIQMAADVMAPVYARTNRRDGYVSLEVSPYLAHDTAGTIAEARRLWQAVHRPNVMIKVPATPAGIPAIQQLISEGININVTLLFHMAVYEQVAAAYIAGVEALVAGGGDPRGVASVASFFVSRIDTAVDSLIEARLQTAQGTEERLLRGLLGTIAIANARLTYQRYKAIYGSVRWQALAAQGAQTQRLLWASTSTKNPQYRDVLYVEELIGRDTVNTIPTATFDAFRDHGHVRASLEEHLEAAHHAMESLERVGISMQEVTAQLLADGVKLFADPFAQLLSAVGKKLAGAAR